MQCVQLVGGEASVAGTDARGGVARAGDASRINWTGVEGTRFSMGRKGEGEALLWDLGVRAGLGGPSGRDFIHDKRLFRCGGNKEGELFWVGVWDRILLSIDPWILTDLLEACEAVSLLLSPMIGSSISPKFKKKEH